MEITISAEIAFRTLIKSNIITFAKTITESDNLDSCFCDNEININSHNLLFSVLGNEIKDYIGYLSFFNSSLGNMLENLAMSIASLFYQVSQKVGGTLYYEQASYIEELINTYNNRNTPSVNDYNLLRIIKHNNQKIENTQDCNYYLLDKEKDAHYLIVFDYELKNKNSSFLKKKLLEQYAILSNTLSTPAAIYCYFASAYNRFDEDKEWGQSSVRQFFSEKELLIGKDFWNFVCKSHNGFEIVIDEFRKNSLYLTQVLDKYLVRYKY